ncbi:MAG: pacearchaeosortase [Candidatus Nanoarchaeia archaeon]
MNKKLLIFIRYLIVIIAGLGNLALFYHIFTPTTSYAVSFLLSLFGQVSSFNKVIVFNSTIIRLIPACIAGSAYYLLFFLCLSIPLKIEKRLALITFSFIILLFLNIIRITILALLAGSIYFQSLHFAFWYIISTIMVFLVWIISIKIFNIKSIPLYTDIKQLFSN